jgi:O-antigen ligase
MMFLCGLGYCLWLRRADPDWLRRRVVSGLPWTGGALLVGGIVLGLLMTQSRGPWLGALMMLGISWLARARSVKRAAMVLAGLVIAAGIVGYVFGSKYTEGSRLKAHDEEQENAIYRRELLSNYVPLVWQKPVTGWGITQYPSVGGQKSIDNEYLLLAVTEGLPGLALFLLISSATAWRLVQLLRGKTNAIDRLLLFTHLGVLVGLWTTIASVYLGLQVQILFYLIVGWVQAMEPERLAQAVGATEGVRSRFGFANVLTRGRRVSTETVPDDLELEPAESCGW